MRVVLAIAALLIAAVPAPAATVEVRVIEYDDPRSRSTEYLGVVASAPGETDRLEVRGGEALVVRGDGLVAGPGCTGGGTEVTCAGPVTRVDARLGDGDDALDTTVPQTIVDAGPGDDVVTGARLVQGGPGADVLTGTADYETFDGGPGADRMSGLDGDDDLTGGDEDRAPDVIDGGGGRDTLRYEQRSEGVHVDLAAGIAGVPGEGDSVASVEWVRGGEGPDVLRGDAAAEILYGAGGDDLVDGRGGDDLIHGDDGDDALEGGDGDDEVNGTAGRDRLSGGAGDDRLYDADGGHMSGGQGDDLLDVAYLRRGPRSYARCGPGADLVGAATGNVRVAADCEAAGNAGIVVLAGPVVRRGAVAWRVQPRIGGRRRTFQVRVRLRGGHLAGRGRFVINRRRGGTVRVDLDRRGRRALRGAGPLRVRVTLLEHGEVWAAWTTAV